MSCPVRGCCFKTKVCPVHQVENDIDQETYDLMRYLMHYSPNHKPYNPNRGI